MHGRRPASGHKHSQTNACTRTYVRTYLLAFAHTNSHTYQALACETPEREQPTIVHTHSMGQAALQAVEQGLPSLRAQGEGGEGWCLARGCARGKRVSTHVFVDTCACICAVADVFVDTCACACAVADVFVDTCACVCAVADVFVDTCACVCAVVPVLVDTCACVCAVAPVFVDTCACVCAVAPVFVDTCACVCAVAHVFVDTCACVCAVVDVSVDTCSCVCAVADVFAHVAWQARVAACVCGHVQMRVGGCACIRACVRVYAFVFVLCVRVHLPAPVLRELNQAQTYLRVRSTLGLNRACGPAPVALNECESVERLKNYAASITRS